MTMERQQKPEQAAQQSTPAPTTGGAPAPAQKPKDLQLDHSENGAREANLRPFFDAMQRIAVEVAPKFKPLGMQLRPEILLSVAMQESGGSRDPANAHSFDDGLGLMQITPYNGQLDDNLAKMLNWDNAKSVEYNVAHSRWRDADVNIRAGATELLNKAQAIKSILRQSQAGGIWDEMDEPHRWRAVSYAYNAGQGAAAKALIHGGPNAPMISTFMFQGKRVTHDYTAEMEARQDYIEQHDPFGGSVGGQATATGQATKGATPEVDEQKQPARSNNGPPPIEASVGQGGANHPKDVKKVQKRLHERGIDCGVADGVCGPHTMHGIRLFQYTFMDQPDGLIEPGHGTMKHLFLENGIVHPTVQNPQKPVPATGGTTQPAQGGDKPGKVANTSVVKNTAALPRVKSSVKLTAPIEAAYQVLAPYLSASVWLTSGLRSDEDQARIINEYYVDNGGPASVKDVEARREWLGKKGFIIARVGSSPHRTGLAFDLSGDSLGTIRAAVDKCAAEHPQDFYFKDTIVERSNNCLHVDLSR